MIGTSRSPLILLGRVVAVDGIEPSAFAALFVLILDPLLRIAIRDFVAVFIVGHFASPLAAAPGIRRSAASRRVLTHK